jgi:hypothetical protein
MPSRSGNLELWPGADGLFVLRQSSYVISFFFSINCVDCTTSLRRVTDRFGPVFQASIQMQVLRGLQSTLSYVFRESVVVPIK